MSGTIQGKSSRAKLRSPKFQFRRRRPPAGSTHLHKLDEKQKEALSLTVNYRSNFQNQIPPFSLVRIGLYHHRCPHGTGDCVTPPLLSAVSWGKQPRTLVEISRLRGFYLSNATKPLPPFGCFCDVSVSRINCSKRKSSSYGKLSCSSTNVRVSHKVIIVVRLVP